MKGNKKMPSNRASDTQTTSTTRKPSLPFKILGTMTNGEPFDFPCSRTTVLKTAKDYMKMGFQGVTIWEHNGTDWVENATMTEQAKTGVQGGGNTRGVMALQQLNEHTNILVKLAGKAQRTDTSKDVYDAEVKEWLRTFGVACQSLRVTPSAINDVLGSLYNQPAEA